jgi:serine/threonine protein kinase
MSVLLTETVYFDDMEVIRKFIYTILSVVDHLNSHGIMHRDIKPSNIMITN